VHILPRVTLTHYLYWQPLYSYQYRR